MEKQGQQYPQAHEMQNQQPPVYHSPPPDQAGMYPPPGQAYAQSPPIQQQQTGQYFQQQPQPGQAGSPAPVKQDPSMMQGTSAGDRQFQNVTPIASLGRGPAPVDCPACGQRGMTNINYEVGNSTHAWALGLCLCLCLGCIPYCVNSLKDVQHKCGKCGVLLATWHRSGSTEVHIHN